MNIPNVGPIPTDTIAVLTHGFNKVTKTWKRDGTIAAFDDAKYYRLERIPVDGIGLLNFFVQLFGSA